MHGTERKKAIVRAFWGIRKSDLRFYAPNESYNCSLLRAFFPFFCFLCASPNAATSVSFLSFYYYYSCLYLWITQCTEPHTHARARPHWRTQRPNIHSTPLWEPSKRTYYGPALLCGGRHCRRRRLASKWSFNHFGLSAMRRMEVAEAEEESRWICSILMTILLVPLNCYSLRRRHFTVISRVCPFCCGFSFMVS